MTGGARYFEQEEKINYDCTLVPIFWFYERIPIEPDCIDGKADIDDTVYKLNAAWNCLDRHLEDRGNRPAIIWEGDDPSNDLKITYSELHERVCKFANALKSLGEGVRRFSLGSIYLNGIPFRLV